MRIDVKCGSCRRSFFFNSSERLSKILKLAEIILADEILINSHWRKVENLKKFHKNKTLGGLN